MAAAHAGADPSTLVNADVAGGWRRWGPGRWGRARGSWPSGLRRSRAALRGFSVKLLTFDVLVDALAGD